MCVYIFLFMHLFFLFIYMLISYIINVYTYWVLPSC